MALNPKCGAITEVFPTATWFINPSDDCRGWGTRDFGGTLKMVKDRLNNFLDTGIYRLRSEVAVFIDPVRILNRSYSRFRVSPSRYYSRFFHTEPQMTNGDKVAEEPEVTEGSRKRKRKKKQKVCGLNEKEQLADQRHQEARPLLLKAHEEFLRASELMSLTRYLRILDEDYELEPLISNPCDAGNPLIELGTVWQAPLFEITLKFDKTSNWVENGDCAENDCGRSVPAFNNLIWNDMKCELEAEFHGCEYVLPRESGFYMSDLGRISDLIPDDPNSGFNLILIDPPWENRSAYQKSMYPTLPNRHFLGLPIRRLTHPKGALIALWVTNREKLRNFVENELFPAWGIKHAATFYWLKVKSDGYLIGDLDLFHHRPYECLLLGYSTSDKMPNYTSMLIPDQVIISVPGAYSRKPPLGELLMEYTPGGGTKGGRCLELFAREMFEGWTSWGNEPLHYQDSSYFLRKK